MLRRHPDPTGLGVVAGVVALALVSVAVYLLRREWLGSWLSGHLTNTVFVFVVVVGVSLGGLVLVVARWVGYALGVLALGAALALEVRQGFTPGQAFDVTDAWLSVVATALALALVAWLDRSHLRRPAGAGG